jgi:phage host-nuclease inhibitor protein Gam
MTRIKPATFTLREEFERAIDEIAKLETAKRALAAARDAAVQAVQEEHGPDIQNAADQIEGLTLLCEKYALTHRDELLSGDRKSAETPLAVFGFRLGNVTLKLLNRKWTWEQVVEALKSAPTLRRYVRVKEEVDKDGIKANPDLDDARLAGLGLRLEQTETFFIEPKAEGSGKVEVAS